MTVSPLRPENQPSTGWGTGDNYDPSQFLTRDPDPKGDGVDLRTKVSRGTNAQIQSIIEQRLVPEYQTKADFVRDAVLHRLRYLAEQHDAMTTAQRGRIRTTIHAAQIEYTRDWVERNELNVQLVKETLERIAKTGRNSQLMKQAFEDALAMAEGMDEPWASQVEEIVTVYKRGEG